MSRGVDESGTDSATNQLKLSDYCMLLTRVRVREAASQVVGISTWLKGRLVAELAGTEKELAGEPEQPIRS